MARKTTGKRAVVEKSARRTTPSTAAIASPRNAAVALRRVSKGTRPRFYDDEAVDQLFAIVTALTAEISVAFDRIDTLERILATRGVIEREEVESFLPNSAAEDERGLQREQRIQRVFAVFEASGAGKSR